MLQLQYRGANGRWYACRQMATFDALIRAIDAPVDLNRSDVRINAGSMCFPIRTNRDLLLAWFVQVSQTWPDAPRVVRLKASDHDSLAENDQYILDFGDFFAKLPDVHALNAAVRKWSLRVETER